MVQKRNGELALILALFFCCVGGYPSAWANSCVAEKTFGREDKTLFARHCGVCHSLSGLWPRVGPPLRGLFERKQLVTGKPVTEENVREVILKGGPQLMPGFQYMLTDVQVNEIIRDIRETRCPGADTAKGANDK